MCPVPTSPPSSPDTQEPSSNVTVSSPASSGMNVRRKPAIDFISDKRRVSTNQCSIAIHKFLHPFLSLVSEQWEPTRLRLYHGEPSSHPLQSLTTLENSKLSLIDGMIPFCFVPIVLFYSASDVESFDTDFTLISAKLKKSLSDTLTLYYPFGGRGKGKALVECNDEGVPYS
ncbi:hypothetical protein L6164_000454 [Bauhinia variegata]|uniref:Uncharacterized protein n=1 Tax=Bauhinia variegata TaxID=167791 RepID=A0ACB9Q8T0_BAUVA|nr:hypothetical protein L6164_000454 [Bauhinia variegata]